MTRPAVTAATRPSASHDARVPLSEGAGLADSLVPAWSRYTRIATDPSASKKIVIPKVNDGQALVQRLKDTAGDKASVTGCRRERKAPITKAVYDEILTDLRSRGIELSSREKNKDTSRTGATVTYYGTAAAFENHQEKTKIRMRIRFYANYTKDANGEPADVQRAKPTTDKGFLELKIKAPRPAEGLFVDKYRILAPDKLLSELIHLDPKAESFDDEMKALGDRAAGFGDPEQVRVMFDTMAKLAKVNPGFIKPSVAISYERAGYAYDENAYPVPAMKMARKGLFRRKQLVSTVEPEDVQYQLTVDQNVHARYPLLPAVGAPFPVAEQLDPAQRTAFAAYPADARVLEFKEPQTIARLGRARRSDTHNHFVDALIGRMRDNLLWGAFDEQMGKYGALRRRIAQEHADSDTKNDKISLSFRNAHPRDQQP